MSDQSNPKRLTLDELQLLVQKATKRPADEIIAVVEATTTEIMDKCSKNWNTKLVRPTIQYDLKGRVAGRAINGETVKLNLDLLLDERYQQSMLKQTLPHELAHIVVQQLWPKHEFEGGGHGWRWINVMLFLGLTPDRCHQYDVSQYSKRRSKPNTTYCGCGEHKVTDTIYRRLLSGTQYRCRKCRQILKRERG